MATICSEQNRSVFDVDRNQTNTVKGRRESSPSWLSEYRRRFVKWMELRREQRESRDAFAHLLKLDDSLLDDIGVTRADVQHAAKLPLAQDAALVLREAAGKYRNNRV